MFYVTFASSDHHRFFLVFFVSVFFHPDKSCLNFSDLVHIVIFFSSFFQITKTRKAHPRQVSRLTSTQRKPRPAPDGIPDLLSNLCGRNSDSSGKKPRSHLVKSYTHDALENEYYSSSSYNPESLHNCHNTSLDSTTGGPVIIEKLDNGTNIVWNCVSPDSSLTSSNSKDKTVNTETGQNNQISSETREHENTPQLDRSVNGLENPCAIISDPHTAKNDGALVEISAKHNDANDDDELNSIENLEHEAIQDVVKEESVKIGAIRVHSDVKPEETEINACDDEKERVDDEDITETQSEIVADDENTIDKANTVKITNSDDANEVTNVTR